MSNQIRKNVPSEMRTIGYFRCLCTTKDKQRAKELRGQGIEVRVINSKAAWTARIKQNRTLLPFMDDGETITRL